MKPHQGPVPACAAPGLRLAGRAVGFPARAAVGDPPGTVPNVAGAGGKLLVHSRRILRSRGSHKEFSMGSPLRSFTSHIDGRNANVDIFDDRTGARTGTCACAWLG